MPLLTINQTCEVVLSHYNKKTAAVSVAAE
jgi:hypothetical protein